MNFTSRKCSTFPWAGWEMTTGRMNVGKSSSAFHQSFWQENHDIWRSSFVLQKSGWQGNSLGLPESWLPAVVRRKNPPSGTFIFSVILCSVCFRSFAKKCSNYIFGWKVHVCQLPTKAQACPMISLKRLTGNYSENRLIHLFFFKLKQQRNASDSLVSASQMWSFTAFLFYIIVNWISSGFGEFEDLALGFGKLWESI